MPGENGWVFARRGPSDMEQEVTEADQFNTESVQITESLVRESTQNSQDARDPTNRKTVRVCFNYLTSSDGLNKEYLSNILSDMVPHLNACGIQAKASETDELDVFTIEDFGTTGLTGSTHDDADEGDFRSFWFRHGRSYKHGRKNGRWGLGKLTFPISSGVRCFFGVTVRRDDSSPLLLGQAVTKTHRVGKKKFAPHGHFGRVEGSNVRPINDYSDIEQFNDAFGLTRTTEPGLSIVVPLPREKPNKDRIIEFIARNYAYPILTDRLIVEALGTVIDSESLKMMGDQYLPNGMLNFIETIHSGRINITDILESELARIGNKISEDLIASVELEALRRQYADGDPVGFRVPVSPKRRGQKESTRSHFHVFLSPARPEEEGGSVYVRGEITVPDEAATFRGNERRAFGALIADDDAISEFLGDAENPAHTKWFSTAGTLREKWTNREQTLGFVRTAPSKFHHLISQGQETEDERALLDFFWVHGVDKNGSERSRQGKKPSAINSVVEKFDRKRWYRIQKLKGGFEILPDRGIFHQTVPQTLRVRLAYDVENGNPLQDWEPFDFDLTRDTNIEISITGCDYEIGSGNSLDIIVEDREFEARIRGFDVSRDLYLTINRITGSS